MISPNRNWSTRALCCVLCCVTALSLAACSPETIVKKRDNSVQSDEGLQSSIAKQGSSADQGAATNPAPIAIASSTLSASPSASSITLASTPAPVAPPSTTTPSKTGTAKMPMGKMPIPKPADIKFKNEVKTNVVVPKGLDGMVFLDKTGKRVALKKYLGKQNVVLVFTEGFSGGMLCPFCKTQVSRLVANYDKFAKLNTEVLVVYPGTRSHLDEFIEAAKTSEKKQVDRVPFPLVLDEDLSAVGFFNIKSNLAHPSTFIIDKSGNVRLAYVGNDMSADRPSVKAMLDVLKSL